MDTSAKALNMALNQTSKQLNELYHAYAVRYGLSDPAFWVLYVLFESQESVTQNELAHTWCYPKQTINFTITSLAKKGYVQLKQRPGIRSGKSVCLTEDGLALCQRVIAPLVKAEERSLLQLTEEERIALVTLNEKQCTSFAQEIQTLLQKPES